MGIKMLGVMAVLVSFMGASTAFAVGEIQVEMQKPEVHKPEVQKPEIQKPEVQKPEVHKAERPQRPERHR